MPTKTSKGKKATDNLGASRKSRSKSPATPQAELEPDHEDGDGDEDLDEDEDEDEDFDDEEEEQEEEQAKQSKAKAAKPTAAAKKPPRRATDAEPPAVVPARRLTPEARAAVNAMVAKGVSLQEALRTAASWETFVAPVKEEPAKLVQGRGFDSFRQHAGDHPAEANKDEEPPELESEE